MADEIIRVLVPQTDVVRVDTPVQPEVVRVVERGLQGPPGITGGAFVHTQSEAAAQWTVTHNLNKKPTVVVLLTGESVPVTTDVTYVDNNSLLLDFPSPVTGSVHI